ncbi:hypothetical protein [Pelagicoccus mobilis]|uniref:DUF4412 domain-containing protein n=1 Tax=Pelagicoccus mobilis TaxID=415221 RepID=A0A934RWP3_9BACT|nr:hypothetical protein [Pelagicoccus mobilis]MBK1876870.1 hypothetical protein [Pelagicoccus mobilis]
MRFSLFLICSCFVIRTIAWSDEAEPFEGRIIYDVDSGGMKMTYTVMFKGDKWRSELKSGKQVFDLRIGDLGERTAFLVNEGGKSYRMIGGMGPGGGRGMKPQGDKGSKGKSPEDELEKAVVVKKDRQMILEYECRLEQLKGAGTKLGIWLAEAKVELPGVALPRVKAFEGKERLLAIYFRDGRGLPLLIEAGSGKNRFEMRVVELEAMPIDESLVSLSDEYKPEGGMRPMRGGGGGKPGGGRPGGGGRKRM